MNALFIGDRVRFGAYEGVVVGIGFRQWSHPEIVVEFGDGSRGILFSNAVRKLERAA